MTTPTPTALSRIRGCLLGGAVGDALGAAIEFDRLPAIRSKYGPAGLTDYAPAYGRLGAITDDTQMTLFTAEGLIQAAARMEGKGIAHPTSMIYHAYLRWLDTQGTPVSVSGTTTGGLIEEEGLRHRRAPGNTCLSALMSGQMGTPDRPLNNSKGCGGVMRVAPIGLVIADPFEMAVDVAAITHGHPSGYFSSGAFAVMLQQLMKGDTVRAAVEAGLRSLGGVAGADETRAALRGAIELTQRPDPSPEKVESLGGGWVAEEALAITVYCALVAEGFEEAVLLAVNHSGDSDSTGSLVGQLLGTHSGIESIPQQWLDRLELHDLIDGVAHDLHRTFHQGGGT